MSASEKRSYEFGSFRLDAAEYVLLRDGQVVPLTPKVFETLLVLVQNSGHVVDKNELYKQVWQDAFVEETNLTKNISILRKILSEGEGDTNFIETVPKRGYRFVVPVREAGAEYNGNGSKPITSVITQVDVAPPASNAKGKYNVAVVLGIAAVVIAGVAFGLYKFAFPKKTNISLASTQITRLTSSGTAVLAAISADGKWLAYVENDGDRESLWLKQVAVPSSNAQIIGPVAGRYTGVAISPDANYVYYTHEAPGVEGTLYQLPVLGGAARKLITGIMGPVTFSPDGKRIAYFHWINDEDRLMLANADGSEQRQLVTRSGNEYFVHATNGPSWSPDGKTLLTSIGTFTPELSMTVATVSPENGAIALFSQQKFQQIWDTSWLSDGDGVLVSATDQFGVGRSQIWHISYPSGTAQKITNDLNSYRAISFTRDSNALATVQTQTLGNLWISSLNNLDRGSQITAGTNLANSPSWTPDGKVVYALNSGGNFDLYLLDPRGGTPKQLTANAGNNHSPVVSPDGRYIVFVSDRSGILCLWRIDIDGLNPKQLNNQTSISPDFAPDGQTVVYTSVVNKFTTSTISIDGDEVRQVTGYSSAYPAFSPDGTRIACVYSEKQNTQYNRIAIIPPSGGPPVKTFPLPGGFSPPFRWTPDGKALMFRVSQRGVSNLWVQAIEGGEPKQITNFTSDLIHWFDVSRDGKQFVLSRGTSSSDVVLFSGIEH